MEVQVDRQGSQVNVVVVGEVDAHNRSDLGDAILADLPPAATVTIDAAGLAFIDSSGISELLRVRQVVDEAGGTVSIQNAGASVKRVLEITGLLDTFDVS